MRYSFRNCYRNQKLIQFSQFRITLRRTRSRFSREKDTFVFRCDSRYHVFREEKHILYDFVRNEVCYRIFPRELIHVAMSKGDISLTLDKNEYVWRSKNIVAIFYIQD